MHIDIWSDVACPWCYLAVRHLRQALSAFAEKDKVTVRLHAYFLQPELTGVDERSEAQYLAQTKGMTIPEVNAALEAVSALGAKEGIRFDWENVKVASTTNAHRLICLAREIDVENDTTTGPDTLELKVHEALGRARFEYGMNLANPESLLALASDFQIDTERVFAALESQTYANEVFSDFQIGVQMGVNAVPVFIFDNAYLVEGAQPTAAFQNILQTAWNHSHSE
ncbi:DsbA family oxidoreductase [Gleimia sp. 6138-11-ORH1]|uniref:DsbA family oxidoreductase n=1 Tax=Gleimia sp. 6138-11-ORH1 TaxID=2973937 RepID=UPI002167DA94|nr:DsbA family oxidoreductase [Gleimia sp. 6138-11-ORH1]MCS4484279.1 DsbA family oxidoreductase [Gleimia sp. 6138-11-ORH1]